MSHSDEKEKNFAELPKNCPMCGFEGQRLSWGWSEYYSTWLRTYECKNLTCLHIYVQSYKHERSTNDPND